MLYEAVRSNTVANSPVQNEHQSLYLETAKKKIEQLSAYQANWGGYNERGVKKIACEQAKRLLSTMLFYRPNWDVHIYPTTDGDIGLEWDDDQAQEMAAICTGDVIRIIEPDHSYDCGLYDALLALKLISNEL